MNLIELIFGPKCPCCERRSKTVCKRSQQTAYEDDSLNWFTGCDECAEENDRYWADMWSEYWSSVF